jgi:hypothetical protein
VWCTNTASSVFVLQEAVHNQHARSLLCPVVRHKVVPLHDQHAGAPGDLRVLPTTQTSTRHTYVV